MLPASDVRSPTFCTLCLPKENSNTDDRDSGNRSLPFLLGGPVSRASPQQTSQWTPGPGFAALAQRGIPRAVPTSPRTTERPDQLRSHFAAKPLPSGFQIDGAIESPQEFAQHWIHHGALIDAGIFHVPQYGTVCPQRSGSRIDLHRSCPTDLLDPLARPLP